MALPRKVLAPRRLALALVSLAALLLAAPGSAGAQEFGLWRVTATGSVNHAWTLTSDAPCAAVGSGRVVAFARGRSKRFRLGYYARNGYRHWNISPPAFRARGTIRRTDATQQNPPQADGEACTPTPKNGCGVRRRLHRRAIGSVEGMVPRRWARITFSFYNLMDAFPRRSRCQTGGFADFNNYPGAPYAEYGRMIGRMPRPSRIRRRAFTVRIVERRTSRRASRRTTTVRRVRLRFTPA